ncbi:oligosaccharide flippase family protein [Flexithrix dorotheae]|uniref:oligosaccharide flippase family protein n=1 Tax=Flexithrix dorotheae TaxID=70993 RepID=UPI00037B6534|nr:oligosaccharide flippase family protein [Flexithrix dorotheae]
MIKSGKKASKAILFGNIFIRGISIIASVILARILTPEDYGYWVLVTLVTSFFTLVIDVGLETYYIIEVNFIGDNKTPSDEIDAIENSVFFLRVLFNTLLCTTQYFSGFLLGDFFDETVIEIIQLLSLIYLISIFGKINEMRLKKRLDFLKITKASVIGELLGIILKVGLAISGFGVFCFAYGAILKQVVYTGVLVRTSGFTPKFNKIKKNVIKKTLWFAKHSWISGISVYLSQQGDKFFLKNNYSLSSVGFYNFSSSTAAMPVNYLLGPQQSLVMSYLSNYKQDTKKLIHVFDNLFLFASSLIPFFVLGIVYSDYIIPMIFGTKWIPAITSVKIFLLFNIFKIILFPYFPILTALGEIKINTRLVISKSIILISILYVITWLLLPSLEIYITVYCMVVLFFDLIKAIVGVKKLGVKINDFPSLSKQFFVVQVISGIVFTLTFSLFDKSLLESLGLTIAYIVISYIVFNLLNLKTVGFILDFLKK